MSADETPDARGAQIHCHICSAALPPDATFCLQCGSRVRAVPPAPTAATTVGASPLPPPPSATPRHATMLGVAAPSATVNPRSPLTATVVETHPAGSMVHPPMPEAPPTSAEPAAAPALGLPAQVANKQRTMIGVAREGLALPPVKQSIAPVPSMPAPPASMPAAAAPSAAPRAHTMMGVAPPVVAPPPLDEPRESMPPAAADPVARRRKESPPFIGGQRLGSAPPSFPPNYAAQPSEDDLRVSRGRPVGLWIAGALVAVALLGGGAVLAMRAIDGSGPLPLQAQVALVEGALRVRATVPGADARWRVMYRGAEFPVDAGGAVDFPLTGLDPNEVGEIVLPIEVRDAAGVRSARSLHIVIGYRVTADLEHLGDAPPRVHLRFRVPAGATLAIAGQPITLAGQLGVAEIPAPAPMAMESPTGSRTERFPIEVRTSGGVVIRGEYELRLPRLPLRIEAPGPLSLMNASMVTVEGSLPRATRVLVGTHAATLMGDHFRAEVPIAPGANSLSIQGFAPGGAPVTTTISVYRSVTPQDYLASGGGDRGVAPLVTPAATSVRLKVRGRVINSTQSAGELPTFQLLVSDRACPNQQCLAWVDMPPGTLVRANETVEVVGETHGTRTYTNQTGQRRTDAVIRSLFLSRP